MTIQVNFIEGNRRSVSNNDAYAVVDGTKVISILPVSILRARGLNRRDLQKAFETASEKITCKNAQKRYARQESYARKLLGL